MSACKASMTAVQGLPRDVALNFAMWLQENFDEILELLPEWHGQEPQP